MLAQIKLLLLAAVDGIIKQGPLIFVVKRKEPLKLRPISGYTFF